MDIELSNFTEDLLPQPGERSNMPVDIDGAQVGLLVMPTPIPGQTHCFIPGVKRIPAEGNHNVLVDVRDRNGNRIDKKRVAWREWFGGEHKELIISKPPNEINDLPLWTNMRVFVDGVMDENLPTGAVTDLTTKVADDNLGTFGHQLYVVCFWERPISELPDVEPAPEPIAKFSYTPSSPVTVGQEMEILNQSENAVRISWILDGSAIGNIEKLTYTPKQAGSFTIVLTAIGADGTTDQSSKSIEVIELAPPDNPIDDIGGIECFSYRDVFTVVSKIGGLFAKKPKEDELTAGYVAVFIDREKLTQLENAPENEGKSFITIYIPTLEEGQYNTLWREENEAN